MWVLCALRHRPGGAATAAARRPNSRPAISAAVDPGRRRLGRKLQSARSAGLFRRDGNRRGASGMQPAARRQGRCATGRARSAESTPAPSGRAILRASGTFRKRTFDGSVVTRCQPGFFYSDEGDPHRLAGRARTGDIPVAITMPRSRSGDRSEKAASNAAIKPGSQYAQKTQ